MAPIEEDQLWIVLIGVFIVVDSWKAYLTIRNIRAIKSYAEVPPQLQMGPREFSQMQTTMVLDSSYILTSLVLNFGSKIAKLLTNYYPYIWDLSGNYGESLTMRAMWFSALDAILDKGKFIPIGLLIALLYGGVDPFIIFINMTVSTATTAFAQALATYFAILLTSKFGPSGLLKLSLVTNLIGLLVVAVYIGWLVPANFERLPDNESGRSVTALAARVGYPANAIFVDSSDSLPNAFYSNALFCKMIIITKSLIASLNPPQLTSVVAHELGHWNYRHPHFTFLTSIIEVAARGFLWPVSYASPWFISAYRLNPEVHPIVPVLLTDFFIRPPLIDLLRGIFKLINTSFEYVADEYACQVWNANNLREALVKISNTARSYPIFDSWFSAWFFGHPSSLDRIYRLEARELHRS